MNILGNNSRKIIAMVFLLSQNSSLNSGGCFGKISNPAKVAPAPEKQVKMARIASLPSKKVRAPFIQKAEERNKKKRELLEKQLGEPQRAIDLADEYERQQKFNENMSQWKQLTFAATRLRRSQSTRQDQWSRSRAVLNTVFKGHRKQRSLSLGSNTQEEKNNG